MIVNYYLSKFPEDECMYNFQILLNISKLLMLLVFVLHELFVCKSWTRFVEADKLIDRHLLNVLKRR